MKLSEIFSQLSYGELSQMSIGGAQPGIIDATNYANVLSHVNLGLVALYKRFPLKEGRMTVLLRKGKITYPLASAFALNNLTSIEPYKYIIDTPITPFLDDILKIESVYTDSGNELALNDSTDEYSVNTPSASLLQIPWDLANQSDDLPSSLITDMLQLVYRARCSTIVIGTSFNPANVEVDLPHSHLEALLLFVASRINNPIGLMSGNSSFTMGNNYAAKYEAACKELETVNLRVDQNSTNVRIQRNGWV